MAGILALSWDICRKEEVRLDYSKISQNQLETIFSKNTRGSVQRRIKVKNKFWLLLTLGLVGVALLALAACAAPTPEKVIEKVVETVVVKETVMVAGTPEVVEKVVTQEVEKVVTVEVEKPAAEVPANWASLPMDETTTVVLSVESGAQEKTLGSFHDEILEKLNIDLQVVAHPFSEQYEIQYLDLSSGAGQYDVLSFWPVYTGDFAPYLEPLKNIAPGGRDQV